MLNKCISNFDECSCHCHNPPRTVRHIMPCCNKYNICNKLIKFGPYEAHHKRCSDSYNQRLEESLGRPLTEEEKK